MRRHLLPGALAAVALVAAGCGSSDDSSSPTTSSSSKSSSSGSGYARSTSSATGGSGSGTHLTLAADPSGAIKFDKKALTAKAGKVTIRLTNRSQVPHAIAIEGNGVEKKGPVVTGGKSTVTVSLKPGKYTFDCPVADHEEEGMKGTLTVG